MPHNVSKAKAGQAKQTRKYVQTKLLFFYQELFAVQSNLPLYKYSMRQ